METILRKNIRDIHSDELRTLGTQISTFLGDISLSVKCTFRSNRLVVLGEHAADIAIDTESVLGHLERNIQALQIQFTQHVRLYLRHVGQKQPYAYRQFVLAPPPPPRVQSVAPVLPDGEGLDNPMQSSSPRAEESAVSGDSPESTVQHSALAVPGSSVPGSSVDEQPWIVGDAELDVLVHQLTALDPLENWELEAQGSSPDENHDEAQRYLEDVVAEGSDLAQQDSGWPSVDMDSVEVDPVDHQEATTQLSQAESPQDDWVKGDEGQILLDDGLIPGAVDLNLPEAVTVNSTVDLGAEVVSDQLLAPEGAIISTANVISTKPGDASRDADALDVHHPAMQRRNDNPEPDPPQVSHQTALETDYSSGHDGANQYVAKQSTDLVSAETQSQALVPNLEQPFLMETPSDGTQELARQPQGFSSFTYETSQRLRDLSRSLLHPKSHAAQTSIEKAAAQQPPTAQLESNGYNRLAIATLGVASLGLATGVYGATRPCVLGPCEALLNAEQLGDKSHRIMRQAQTWTDVEGAVPPLTQAIEILEPIPAWSSHSTVAQDHMQDYTLQLGEIDQLLDVEQAVVNANKLSNQAVYTFDDLNTVRSLWQSAMDDLDVVPLDSPLHDFSQKYLEDYQDDLANADQQLQQEETAMATLETAKQAAQLAQVRQGVAQSLENWQFARVTWIVALDRLAQVADNTLASREADRLATFYQSSLDEVDVRVRREKGAAAALEKATRHADMASAAEQRHDWAQAIADWNHAIEAIQQINRSSTYYLKAENLLNQYQDSVAQVQNKLEAKTVIEGELRQSCLGELQLCHIVSIGQSIKLELDDSYLDAITTARGNGNYNVQAVVTDHQLMVRDSLDRIANNFNLPIEVYNPDGGLLERHIPNPLSNSN